MNSLDPSAVRYHSTSSGPAPAQYIPAAARVEAAFHGRSVGVLQEPRQGERDGKEPPGTQAMSDVPARPATRQESRDNRIRDLRSRLPQARQDLAALDFDERRSRVCVYKCADLDQPRALPMQAGFLTMAAGLLSWTQPIIASGAAVMACGLVPAMFKINASDCVHLTRAGWSRPAGAEAPGEGGGDIEGMSAQTAQLDHELRVLETEAQVKANTPLPEELVPIVAAYACPEAPPPAGHRASDA